MAVKHVRLKKSILLVMVIAFALLVASVAILAITALKSEDKIAEIEQAYTSQIAQLEDEIRIQNENYVTVPVLVRDVEAGETIAAEDLSELHVAKNAVPTNAADIENAVGKIIKIDMKQNSILTSDMLYQAGEIADDLRIHEYTVINLPSKLSRRDVVDVRLNLPTGQDYVVLSKKRVEDLEGDRVWYTLGEQEILMMSSAIVDAYEKYGILYAVEYVEPEMQKAAAVTYPPNEDVLRLIKSNPNILEVALSGLEERMREQMEESFLKNPNLKENQSGRAPAPFNPVSRSADEEADVAPGNNTQSPPGYVSEEPIGLDPEVIDDIAEQESILGG